MYSDMDGDAGHTTTPSQAPGSAVSEAVRELVAEATRLPVSDAEAKLSQEYAKLVDRMLQLPEVQQSLTDMNISGGQLRKSCIDNAESLFREAASEYDAYRGSQDRLQQYIAPLRKNREADRIQVALIFIAFIPCLSGILALLAGFVLQAFWHSLPYSRVQHDGVYAFVSGAALGGLAILRTSDWALINQSTHGRRLASVRNAARDNLLRALEDSYLLPFIRTKINEHRSRSLGQEFTVREIVGLSAVHENAYHVPTAIADRLDSVIRGLSGASIGIAGSRGSGKSALLSRYCQESVRGPSVSSGNITCLVAAPVDYAARDFVLYLFASFCRAVLLRMDAQRFLLGARRGEIWSRRLKRLSPFADAIFVIGILWLAGFLLWHFRKNLGSPWSGIAQYPALLLVAFGYLFLLTEQRRVFRDSRIPKPAERIRTAAQRSLQKVRFLQTTTSGWTGSANLLSNAGIQLSRSATLSEQPLSYPEIVDEFRELVRQVADYLAADGARIYIGIDELDKIGTAEQAERFLNEIKGIFGIANAYFLVSVSDDALAAFERRGLPLRDVFDSCFDEIIRAEPLTYQESRRLLYRRVIGLNEPYIAFCHCLSGGIPRDLIRAARRVVSVGQDLTVKNSATGEPVLIAAIRSVIISEEVARKARAAAQVLTALSNGAEAEGLLHALYALADEAEAGWPGAQAIGAITQGPRNEADSVAALRLEVAGYVYFCQTLRDFFGDGVDEVRMREATESGRHPRHFDALATARMTFSSNTLIAWQMISRFRSAWGLDHQDPPTPADDARGYL